MIQAGQIQEYLKKLTPTARGNLLTELERLEACGEEMPRCEEILATLRAEFRSDESTQPRAGNASRYFFAPLEPLLTDGAPEHANSGRILRGSLAPIWEWISRDLLPAMARDHVQEINELIAADNQRGALRVASTFQTKIIKSIESTLGSPDGADQTRVKLATYTASQAAYGDLAKMLCVLRGGDALAKFQRSAPGHDQEVRRCPGPQDNDIAGWVRERSPRRGSVCADAGGQPAQDIVAVDPPRHQGRAQQGSHGRRGHALRARGLDGA
jgi:hypothetical protein